jgi:hypothetical protein
VTEEDVEEIIRLNEDEYLNLDGHQLSHLPDSIISLTNLI